MDGYIRDLPTTQLGSLEISNNNGTITVGSQVDFVLTGPTNFHNRLFDMNQDLTVKLEHGSTEIELQPLTDPAPANVYFIYNIFYIKLF